MSADLTPSPHSPLEPLAADAAASQAGDPHAPHAHSAGHTHCLNCGTKLEGPFCSACGQHDFDFHRSFGHVFLEALENIFHFDGKFFRNILTLLFKPGKLTAEFNAGKRASQVPPFRLYVFTEFFFFLWIFATSSAPDSFRIGPQRGAAAQLTLDGVPITAEQALKARSDPAYAEQLRQQLAAQIEQVRAKQETTAATPPPAASDERAVDRIRQTAEKFRDEGLARREAEAANKPRLTIVPPEGGAQPRTELDLWAERQAKRAMDPEVQRQIGERFLAALPKMLLFCLPFFALITRLLFRKSGQVYLQHLVIALHFHTFIFLWVMFRDGWSFLLGQTGLAGLRGGVLFALNLWMVVYPVLMLRRLFSNSWPWTVLKTVALALLYWLTLACAFILTGLLLVLLM